MQTTESQWVFRVATGSRAGAGHLMRCIALAQVLSKAGEVLFMLDRDGVSWLEYLNSFGFDVVIDTWPDELRCFVAIIDGYEFGPAEYEWFSKHAEYITIIDDRTELNPYADLVVLPSINETHFDSQKRVLSGCKYALLGPEYQRQYSWEPISSTKTVLVSFGMVDSLNCATATLHSLKNIGFNGEVTVMLGSSSPQVDQLQHVARGAKYRLQLVLGEYKAYNYITWADFVIGAGGQSLVERVALGRPSITVVTADNQTRQAEYFESVGATKVTSRLRDTFISDLSQSLSKMVENPAKLAQMSTIANNLVDGKGAERVANILQEFEPRNIHK